jgi:hypothetical protein
MRGPIICSPSSLTDYGAASDRAVPPAERAEDRGHPPMHATSNIDTAPYA